MIIGAIVIILLYLSLNYYIGYNLYSYINLLFGKLNKIMFYIIFSIFVLMSILSFIKIPHADIISFIGSIYLGLFVYFVLLFFIKDIFKLIFKFNTKTTIIVNSLIIALVLSTCIYGLINSRYIKLVSYDIDDNEIKGSYKIALISDLHLGSMLSESNMNNVIDKINDNNVDLVLIVGDLFNDNFNVINNPQKMVEKIKSIKSKYGIYMSLGNHDGGSTYNKMIDFINDSNIKLLNDEYEVINNDFILLGRVDGTPIGGFDGLKRKDTKEVLNSIDSNLPIIVMDHNPLNIDEYDKDINLLLSGHTHKGQMFPANIVTDNMYLVDHGIYESDKYPLTIVTSGAGTWGMPLRIGSNSEVVIININ